MEARQHAIVSLNTARIVALATSSPCVQFDLHYFCPATRSTLHVSRSEAKETVPVANQNNYWVA